MTPAVISAILVLLAAFGVAQPTIDQVQGILDASLVKTQGAPALNVAPSFQSPDIGGVSQITVPTPSTLQVTTDSPILSGDSGGSTALSLTVNPLLSDGSLDQTANVSVSIDALWWFPHEAIFGGSEATKDGTGKHLNVGVPYTMSGIPSQSGMYTLTAIWEGTGISATTSIEVTN